MSNKLSWALDQLNLGKKITRTTWTNQWISVGNGGMVKSEDLWNKHARGFTENLPLNEIEVSSYLLLKTPDNRLIMGWTPSTEDIFADDYIVLND